MFAMPFDEIAPIVGRSTDGDAAARQPGATPRAAAAGRPTRISFGSARSSRHSLPLCALATSRACSLLLDPDLVVRADMAAGAPTEIRGAAVWGKGAVAYGHMAQLTQPALVDGAIGVVVAPRGRLVRALRFTIANGKITAIEIIGNRARLGELDVSIVG